MPKQAINIAALEPLYLPYEEPNAHRIRAKIEGAPAVRQKGRRPSSIIIAQNLRYAVSEWRKTGYPGCSETSRDLLYHWFHRDHRFTNPDGYEIPFHYYFCQREAIETIIYLMEMRQMTSISAITAEFGGSQGELYAQGISPSEERWPKFAFKVATGAGKTKIMSLAVVWSYFHALRESDSTMARHFVIIAPNLTVFERLKEDFGYGKIFDKDPLIPPAWRGDWNLSVVLQDEASGAATGGMLYLTNIHRLYNPKKRRRKNTETYEWMGPTVSRAKALDTGEILRKRVTSHKKLMVLNDEAHHVWSPFSAWSEAIEYLNETMLDRTGSGLVAQLDFSATPKDNKGNLFKYIVCDAPLGEAVDAGIVKTPIIGIGEGLSERADDNAAYKYEQHLLLGYKRWEISYEEWKKSGKKALMFVMCEDTAAADKIAHRLNTDPLFSKLNGKAVNLHTNLKGKLKKRGKGKNVYYEFVENEKEISDEDLKQLRKLSRELDNSTSHYLCIVSVLMLREGWDVRNVTTIVPLRPYTSKANILPEQTLGRGLRRMTHTGNVAEIVTVVEHNAFTSLYKEQLSQEGLPIEIGDIERIPRMTVSIFPDGEHKDLTTLDIKIPEITAAYYINPILEDITFDEIEQSFSGLTTLPLGEAREEEIDYKGRHLITNEIVEQMKIKIPLLENGVGAISFFREELEHATKLRGTHAKLAPLIQRFIEELLFNERSSIFDPRLVSRLADQDVREYIRATFVPLLRKKTTQVTKRAATKLEKSVTYWHPFQVTSSERKPVLPAEKTPFNLVPCDSGLEFAMAQFINNTPDTASFCKNAGPQALRIDYLTADGRLLFYTPDFFVRKKDGSYLLIETKGRTDLDVPAKARAAIEWCKSASTTKTKWEYVYVPEEVFSGIQGNKISLLKQACHPALKDLLHEAESPQMILPLYEVSEEVKTERIAEFVSEEVLQGLPSRYSKGINEAITLYKFLENKEASLSPCFTPLLGPLDEASKGLVFDLLEPYVPVIKKDQDLYFEPFYMMIGENTKDWLRRNASRLKKALVYKNAIMPLGLLSFCLQYATTDYSIGGVFDVIHKEFNRFIKSDLGKRVDHIRKIRNTYIAHQDNQMNDPVQAKTELKNWISGLSAIYRAHNP